VKKVTIIGNFGVNGGDCGQTIKTNVIYRLFQSEYEGEVLTFNTKDLSNPIKFFVLLMMVLKGDKFVILPAKKALPILAILFYILNKKADYIVIGGWLPQYILKTNCWIKKSIERNFRVFVETKDMQLKLKESNIMSFVLPNFKNFEKLAMESILKQRPYFPNETKYVYMSRVIKEKGVIDAIAALTIHAGRDKDKTLIFDIYGTLNKNFEEELRNTIKNIDHRNLIVSYKGFTKPEGVQETLIDYDYFIFPTYYEGEGFPGALVDALSTGLPIIASDWKYNGEIVKNNENGFLYEVRNVEKLAKILNYTSSLEDKAYQRIVQTCLAGSINFHEDTVKHEMKRYGFF